VKNSNSDSGISLKEWIDTHGTDFVVKIRGGKPYISRKPHRDPNRKKSAAEQTQVDSFKLAVQYAKEVIADPEKSASFKAESEKTGRSIYHLAISDFVKKNKKGDAKKLHFESIVAEKTGQHLFVKVNFEEPPQFKKMLVFLYELDHTPVEQGAAEQATITSWWYLVKHSDIAGLPFRARVSATGADDSVFEAEHVIV